jgi:alkyl sulfatase BDS1-like metallo-beta-lactamase superfamily hydrolase
MDIRKLHNAFYQKQHRVHPGDRNRRLPGKTADLTSYPYIVFADSTLNQKQNAGEIHLDGNEEKFHDFLKLFYRFDFWFNIVTP